jgi:SAM-dependent methyltransferase
MHLNELPTNIKNPQKICDAADWQDPRLDYIIRHLLRTQPSFHRRQWEFAMLFKALFEAGKLTPDSVGIGMGAGTERLIYTLAEQVKKVVVTDLYELDSKWVGVRTDDPKALIMSKAPFEVDPERLDVLRMDMRDIKFPDNTFDFAWSTGAIEHIGKDEDFIRHLNEVGRTLKEGGVYAFTTVVIFDDDSARIPNNHYFSPDHLLDLIDASSLHAEPVFNCSLDNNQFNRPIPEQLEDYGLPNRLDWTSQISVLRRGTITAANLMLLRKDSSRPKQRATVEGWNESRQFVERSLDALCKKMWNRWQYLDAFSGVSSTKLKTELTFREKNQVIFRVSPQLFGTGKVELKLLLFADGQFWRRSEIELTIISRSRGWPLDEKPVLTKGIPVPSRGLCQTVEISFEAENSRCYTIEARAKSGKVRLKNISIFARRV